MFYNITQTGQISLPDFVYFSSYSVKCNSCFMLRYLMTSWYLSIWKVKIWLFQERKKLSKWNKKHFSLLHRGSLKKNIPRARRGRAGGRGGGGVLMSLKSELKRIGGGGVKPICTFALWKNYLIFKQQAEFFLISCLAVAKCFLFWAYSSI